MDPNDPHLKFLHEVTLMVLVETGEKAVFKGGGVSISEGGALTCAHVCPSNVYRSRFLVFRFGSNEGIPYKVRRIERSWDLLWLKPLNPEEDSKVNTCTLAEEVFMGTDVFCLHFPLKGINNPMYSKGHVGMLLKEEKAPLSDNNLIDPDMDLLCIQNLNIQGGSSGSGVFSQFHSLVGLITQEGTKGGDYAIPVQVIKSFLCGESPKSPKKASSGSEKVPGGEELHGGEVVRHKRIKSSNKITWRSDPGEVFDTLASHMIWEGVGSNHFSDEKDLEDEGAKKLPKTEIGKDAREVVCDVKAIWMDSPKDVTTKEYAYLYNLLSKNFSYGKPMAWSHFRAEGDVEFKAVLFVPSKASLDLYEAYYNGNKANLKVYVRRGIVDNGLIDLLPKYLNFLKGVVDFDGIENVSLKVLHQHHTLETVKKKLTRMALDMICRIVENEPEESNLEKKSTFEIPNASDEKEGQYQKFWNEFGISIKFGIIEDANHKHRLMKLLRFESTRSSGKLVSLDRYFSRMKPGQNTIFYFIGTSKEQLEKSPFFEGLTKMNYEVILFTELVDECLMQYLMDYKGKKFQNISKEGLELVKVSNEKYFKDSFDELTKWWKYVLSNKNVSSVEVSSRLDRSPCVVVTSKFGWSAEMERVMQSQPLPDTSKETYMQCQRILEINPRHPLIKQLRERVIEDPEDDKTKETARLVYQTALMHSGFVFKDAQDFASNIYNLVSASLNISPEAAVDEDDADHNSFELESKRPLLL